MFDFDTQVQVGNVGEDIARKFYEKRGYVCSKDYYDDRVKGIDLTIRSRTQDWTVQVKNEWTWASTGNVALEVLGNIARNTLGGHRSTKANFILHVWPRSRRIVIFYARPLQRWIEAHYEEYELRVIPNCGWNTGCIIVPVQVLKDAGCVFEDTYFYELEEQ